MTEFAESSVEREPASRIVVVPGARMRQDSDGFFHFPLISPDNRSSEMGMNPIEVSGGESKIAAVEVDFAPGTRVYVAGGNEVSLGRSRADEMRVELNNKRGIPADSVVSIGKIGRTIGNAIDFVHHMQAHPWEFRGTRQIELMENEYKMLRAWLIFSMTLLKFTTGEDLHISPHHKKSIEDILNKPPDINDPKFYEKVRHDRQRIMRILSGYFDGKPGMVHVMPRYVEETLHSAGDGLIRDEATRRYGAMILANSEVRKRTVGSEYHGLRDLLNGVHKGQELITHLQPLQRL